MNTCTTEAFASFKFFDGRSVILDENLPSKNHAFTFSFCWQRDFK